MRTLPWLTSAATALDLPLVSFLHGVAAGLQLGPGAVQGLLGGGGERDVDGSSKEAAVLEQARGALYADCGENVHFNEYGHRLMAELLHGLLAEAKAFSTPFHGARRRSELLGQHATTSHHQPPAASSSSPPALQPQQQPPPVGDEGAHGGSGGLLPDEALEVFSRLSSGSSERTLSCNLTLTQGRGLDLTPSRTANFSLWAESVKEGNKIFSSRTRADRKQTWTPSVEGASIDFDFVVPEHARQLCVLMYGANGMFLEAAFPGHETETVRLPLIDDDDEDDEMMVVARPGAAAGGRQKKKKQQECVQVQADGSRVDCGLPVEGALGPEEHGRLDSYVHERSTACLFRGGVDWTPFSVYKIACDCSLPPRLADGKTHPIRFTSTRGLVQIAGVVIW